LFFYFDHFTDGRTPWTSDRLVTRPLLTHRTTRRQHKHVHTPNTHALCAIRTRNPGFRASEGSTCLRPLGYRDRLGFENSNQFMCRPQWPRGLRYELSSLARTLRSWVRIPLNTWISVCVYSVFVLFCV
jgi:hypothetical protein